MKTRLPKGTLVVNFTVLVFLCISCISAEVYRIELPNGLEIEAEVAKNKQKGLQGRRFLCPVCGMIFIYSKEGYYGFWMKDTLIELGIVWINKNGKVVHIVRDAKPCIINRVSSMEDCKVYYPVAPAKYVLEVNPEALAGVEVGMKVRFFPALN
jgi:uncharacterized membrane protein (UPF0127 family)